MNNNKLLIIVLAFILLVADLSAYKVWLGTHKWEGSGADNLDQWDMVLDKIEGINYVLLDARPNRPTGEGATASDWDTMIGEIDQSIPGMAEIARSQYSPAKNLSLDSRMQNEFATVENRGAVIDIIMLYDEERDGTVYKFTLADAQEVRDWLDNNGQAHVSLCFNLRNNDQERLALAQNPIFDSVMIEASATRWVEDRFNVHTLLQDLWTDPSTRDKTIYFQIPRSESPGTLNQRGGVPSSPMNQYVETRRALWVIKDLMGDEFMRSDQVVFIVCNYSDTYDTYPETASNDTLYVNTKSGLALSLIEQRLIFEGRTGVVNEALCTSYDRYEVSLGPDSGLVAHWPLDEGSGTVAADASGYSYDGDLLNGASWGSDGTRSSYVSFDGTDDRIATAFNYALSDTDDFTWAWWAKKEATSHSGSIMVGNRYGGTGSESLEFIKFMPNKAAFADTGSAANIEDYNYSDLPSNQWHHYAMVKDGTSYQWYVDGVAQGSPVTINYNETSPLPFLIGGDDDGTGTKVNEHFEGCIDDVVLYRSALTPQEVNNVINGIYDTIVTMIDLGSPANSTDGSTWSDGEPAHGGALYVIPATGNLRSELGGSTFPGTSLTVEAGGKFQVRSLDSDGDATIVNNLILAGGPSFGAGQFAELAAGTGTNDANVLNGTIFQSGATRLITYSGDIARSLIIRSQISGNGTLQAVGEGVTITNDSNTFSGTWDTSTSLVFNSGGAVGTADVEVQSGGSLEIKGSWIQNAALTVADTSGTVIKVGSYGWKVSSLTLGGSSIADGIYTPSELDALGNAQFSGTGRITVGTPVFNQEIIAGWDVWSSSTAPVANVTGSGITATATASTASGNWSISDDDGRGSSGDTTWGTFDGNTTPASSVTSGTGANMAALNGVTTAQITLTITNNSEADWELDAFHMDAVAFRSNAPRAYELEVLSGSITNGVVFTSTDDEINEVGGTLSGNHDQHDQIDVSLLGLADSTLDARGTVVIKITFSSGTGSGGGHHLFLDNVAVSGVLSPVNELQNWRYEYFGTVENISTAANSYDANFDGESNLLEFATGQDPQANTLVATPVELNVGDFEFRYARSTAALDSGVTFTVKWSDTLLPGSWSSVGVVDALNTENPGTSDVENRVVTIPEGTNGKRFARLEIFAP